MIKHSSLKVYKYFPINQNLYNSIITNEIYFSNPRTFNDPFDSNPRFKTTTKIDCLKKFFEFIKEQINLEEKVVRSIPEFGELSKNIDVLVDYSININRFNTSDFIANSLNEKLIEIFVFYNDERSFPSFVDIDIIEFQSKLFADFIFMSIDAKYYGIWSASKTSTSPVLWGHYADNHKGVCLEYQVTTEENKSQLHFAEESPFDVVQVKYTSKPIDIFAIEPSSLLKLTNTIINTKYDKWEYEQEIRLINHNQGLAKFEKKALKSIIFGHRTTPKEKYALCKLLAHLKYDLEMFVSKIQPDKYEMKIDKLILEDIAGSGVYLSEMNFKYSESKY